MRLRKVEKSLKDHTFVNPFEYALLRRASFSVPQCHTHSLITHTQVVLLLSPYSRVNVVPPNVCKPNVTV